MRTAFHLQLAIIFLVIAGVQAACAQSKTALELQIDGIFLQATAPDDPGCAVLAKQGEKVVFEKGFGVRELRNHTKIDPHTNFRLASVTKQFTAMAVMLLVHDGKLHYDDRLTDIFPEFPVYGKDITIRNLLTHTGGLPDYEDLMDREEKARGPRWSPENQIQDAEVLALLEREPAGKFAPGSKWAYSNSGYVVLGLVVAKVSGIPYRDFLQKRIFAPASMRHSVVYQKGINEVSDRAFGHSKEGDKFVETDQSPSSATLGDGGVYSSVEDMAKWDDALATHSLLSENEMAVALTPAKLADGLETLFPKSPREDNLAPAKPVSYGFGWFLDPWERHPRMHHSGGTRGFRTEIQRFTADGVTVIVLCNRLDLDPTALAEKAANIVFASTTAAPSTKHWVETADETLWRGRYKNCDHGYLVNLPPNVIGHGGLPPSPNHGILIPADDPGLTAPVTPDHLRLISVYNSYDAADLGSAQAYVQQLELKPEDPSEKITVLEDEKTSFRGYPAEHVHFRKATNSSTVESEELVVYRTPKNSAPIFNVVLLQTAPEHYAQDRALYLEIQKGLEFIPVPRGQCSND